MEGTGEKPQQLPLRSRLVKAARRMVYSLQAPSIAHTREQSFVHGVYSFPFLSDPDFLLSPYKTEIEAFDIPAATRIVTEAAATELGTEKRIQVVTSVPHNRKDFTKALQQTGIGAVTPKSTKIYYYIDPNNPQLLATLRAGGRDRQIAHETCHAARLQSIPDDKTLLYALIAEGLAMEYEENWGGVFSPALKRDALTPKEIQTEWERAQLELLKTRDHQSWFLGGGNHPLWAGYALGGAIVRSYVASHPGQTMREMVGLPSQVILQGSAFRVPALELSNA